MKKFIPLIAILLTTLNCAMAQCVDTTNAQVGESISLYPATGGYISGTNLQHDKAKAEKFSMPVGSIVTGALVFFGAANYTTFAEANTMIYASVYDATGPGGTPGNLLGQDSTTLGSIASQLQSNPSGAYADFTFANRPLLTGTDFFISISMPANSTDTLAIYTNALTDTTGRGWTQLVNGTWQPYNNLYTTSNYSPGNWILAQVCTPVAPPVAYFGTYSPTSCLGFLLIDSSLNLPTSYQWSFPGGTPSTSTEVAPFVNYSTPGFYDVTLIASNLYGSDTLTRHNFFHYLAAPSINFTDVLDANGAYNGSATCIISNAYTPFDLTWSTEVNGNWVTDTSLTGTADTVITLTNLPPGLQAVNYVYGMACLVSGSITINDDSQPQTSCIIQSVFTNGSDSIICYTLNQLGAGSGYVAGNNSAGTQMLAQKVTTGVGASVPGISFALNHITIAPADSNLTFNIKLWKADGPNGAPGTLIASNPLPLNYLAGLPMPVESEFLFSTPVTLNDTIFYAGLDLPTQPGDTMAFYTNSINGYTDGGYVYQNNSWKSLNSLYAVGDGAMQIGLGAEICGPLAVPYFTTRILYGCHGSCAVQIADSSTGNVSAITWATPGCSSGSELRKNSGTLIYNTSGTYYITEYVFNAFGVAHYTSMVTINADTLIPQTLCMVSTDSTDTANTVIWEKADRNSAHAYHIYSSGVGMDSTSYVLIGSVSNDSLSIYMDNSDRITYPIDGHVVLPHRYKIVEEDTCGSYGTISPYIQALFLQQISYGEFEITPYVVEGTPLSIVSYRFLCDSNASGNWYLLQNLTGQQTTVTDPDFLDHPYAQYVLELVINNSCTPGRSSFSVIRSNRAGYFHPTVVQHTGDGMLQFTLAPNPAQGYSIVNTDEKMIGSQLAVIDITGRIVNQLTITGTHTQLNTTGLAAGIYLIQVTDHLGKRGTKRLTVQ